MTNRLSLLLNVRPLDNPLKVGVAIAEGGESLTESKCTHIGDLPLPLANGGYHYQPCYYNPSATNTFIAPDAICTESDGLLTS